MMARKAKDQREKEHLHWQETFRVFTTPRYFITNIMGPPLMLSFETAENNHFIGKYRIRGGLFQYLLCIYY